MKVSGRVGEVKWYRGRGESGEIGRWKVGRSGVEWGYGEYGGGEWEYGEYGGGDYRYLSHLSLV